jgi:ribosome-binding protein aMBF1 (putative translation factor)
VNDAPEVIRCPHCSLVQFMTANGDCRKCRESLTVKELPVAAETVQETVQIAAYGRKPTRTAHIHGRQYDIGVAVWLLRKSLGMTAQTVSGRMGVARSYISKVENDRVVPTPEMIKRLAEALGIPTQGLVEIAGHVRNGRAA